MTQRELNARRYRIAAEWQSKFMSTHPAVSRSISPEAADYMLHRDQCIAHYSNWINGWQAPPVLATL